MDLTVIEVDSVVSIHYSLTLDDGQIVDSSRGREPMLYLHGHGNVVPGLEEELTGRKIGDRFAVRVPPERGYGLPDPNGIQSVPRSQFPADLELEPGMELQAEDGEGNVIALRVTAIAADSVTVDLNHPLAGQTLNFDVEILGIRSATQQELAHGHVHGPGGHHH